MKEEFVLNNIIYKQTIFQGYYITIDGDIAQIKFDEDKMKICKSYDEGNKIIMIKDDNIEIKVILNQK